MQEIQFLGAAGGVTGSSYLLTSDNGDKILIDCGMFQGQDDVDQINYQSFPFDVPSLKAILLTHAHLDHCGRLPLLGKQGFKGKIYTTAASADIARISLTDSVFIVSNNGNGQVLYTVGDVEKICTMFETVTYDLPIQIGELSATFRNAGHILGSASIEISDAAKKIVFSGDLGNSPEDLIPPTEQIESADIVVMESTYGDKTHLKEDVMGILQQEINQIESSNGVLLIPAFSIERTQEIIHRIGLLKNARKINPATAIFLDSPMAIEVTEVFKKYRNLYNKQLLSEKNPFDYANLIITETGEQSRKIIKHRGPKVIIAGSGMMSGGRILHHLKNYISLPTTRLLIVGYQAGGTLGKEIQEGAKSITLYNEQISVKANITVIESLSSHADQPKLLNWLYSIKNVKQVFLTHGEEESRKVLSEKIKQKGITNVILPAINQTVSL